MFVAALHGVTQLLGVSAAELMPLSMGWPTAAVWAFATGEVHRMSDLRGACCPTAREVQMKDTASAGRGLTARDWLLANGYTDIVTKIDRVQQRWDAKRKGTRRNWWDVLAGGRDGAPKRIEGIIFPVLRAARERKDWPVTENSICRGPSETAPEVVQQQKWLSLKTGTTARDGAA